VLSLLPGAVPVRLPATRLRVIGAGVLLPDARPRRPAPELRALRHHPAQSAFGRRVPSVLPRPGSPRRGRSPGCRLPPAAASLPCRWRRWSAPGRCVLLDRPALWVHAGILPAHRLPGPQQQVAVSSAANVARVWLEGSSWNLVIDLNEMWIGRVTARFKRIPDFALAVPVDADYAGTAGSRVLRYCAALWRALQYGTGWLREGSG